MQNRESYGPPGKRRRGGGNAPFLRKAYGAGPGPGALGAMPSRVPPVPEPLLAALAAGVAVCGPVAGALRAVSPRPFSPGPFASRPGPLRLPWLGPLRARLAARRSGPGRPPGAARCGGRLGPWRPLLLAASGPFCGALPVGRRPCPAGRCGLPAVALGPLRARPCASPGPSRRPGPPWPGPCGLGLAARPRSSPRRGCARLAAGSYAPPRRGGVGPRTQFSRKGA